MDKEVPKYTITEGSVEVREISTNRLVFMPHLVQLHRESLKRIVEDLGGNYEVEEKGPADIHNIDDYRLADVIPLFPDQE